MAFDAGSVIGHFKLDSAQYVGAGKEVTKHTGTMTGSFFKAQVAFEAVKRALAAVVNAVKGSVTSWISQEKAIAQTEAVLRSTGGVAGMTKAAVLDLSDGLMALTGIEDDQILAAENLLLTFTKIGKDIFPQATETVLDMSVAMGTDAKSAAVQLGKALQDPILGVTALRRVGVNFNQAQTDVIKNLVQTGRAGEAQAMILKELQKEFGGSAQSARNTFGGALANLKNQIGENQEAIGKYIAIAGRPFVEELGKMAQSTADFMNSAAGMAKIQAVLGPMAGTLSVLFSIGKEVWNLFKNFAGGVLEDVKTGFADVVGKGNESNVIFTVLGGVVKTVGIGFGILGKSVHLVIQWVVDLVRVAKESVDVLSALGDALAHPLQKEKWEKVGKEATEVWDSIKAAGLNAFGNLKDIVTSTIEEFKSFATDSKATGGDLAAVYEEAVAKMNKAFADFALQAGVVIPTTIATGNDEGASDVKKSWTEVFNELTAAADDAAATYGAFSYEAKEATQALADHIMKLSQESSAEWQATYDSLLETAREAIATFGAYSAEAAAAIQAVLDFTGQETEDAAEDVRTSWSETFDELSGEVKKAAAEFGVFSIEGRSAINALSDHVLGLAQDIGGVLSQAVSGIAGVSEQYYDNQQVALDNDYKRRKAYIEANVTDEAERAEQLEALDADYAKKSAAVKKAQFEAQKKASIIQAIISTAQAVMTSYSQFGFPFGLIPAGIMAGIGAAQIAVIASQPTPEFAAEGGTFSPGDRVIVGELGPELLTVGQTSTITPAEDLAAAVGIGREEKPVHLQVSTYLDGRQLIGTVQAAIRNGRLIIQPKDVR